MKRIPPLSLEDRLANVEADIATAERQIRSLQATMSETERQGGSTAVYARNLRMYEDMLDTHLALREQLKASGKKSH